MVTGMAIDGLKKKLAKKPKSLLFAQYADSLRVASRGDAQKLDEALLVANKGVGANPGFLPGKLARGRILLEKGDLAGAKIDFEAVAERDPFCFSAQKLLLETAEKLGQPLQTEIYAKILSTLESESVPAPAAKKPAAAPATPGQAAQSASVSLALDNILEEEENEEKQTEILVFQAVDNIIESSKQPLQLPEATSVFLEKEKEPQPLKPTPSPPAAAPPLATPQPPPVDDIVKEQLVDKSKNLPDLTGDLNSLLASAPDSEPASESTSPPAAAPPLAAPQPPPVDDIVKEQLVDKSKNLPDLTGDLNSLLASAPDSEPASESTSPPAAATPLATPQPPPVDDIVKEQLVDKSKNLPDLTGDMDSLLSKAGETETEPELKPYIPKKVAAPPIDDIVKEQLADKSENLPDLTGDLSSLLASAPAAEPALESTSLGTPPSDSKTSQIDGIVKEQLVDKSENLPDLTGDMDSLLASAPAAEPALESTSLGTPPSDSKTSQIDGIVKEQLVDKSENLPDLTGDMDSLLASAPDSEPALESTSLGTPPSDSKTSQIDDIVKEQLADKSENLPDLTEHLNSLLAQAEANPEPEPELKPYVPKEATAPPIDDIVKEQLMDKSENLPDLTGDMASLLANDEILTQTPTETLAEIYMSQGLPQKAVIVYKDLLAHDPDNAELKAKLALAETKI